MPSVQRYKQFEVMLYLQRSASYFACMSSCNTLNIYSNYAALQAIHRNASPAKECLGPPRTLPAEALAGRPAAAASACRVIGHACVERTCLLRSSHKAAGLAHFLAHQAHKAAAGEVRGRVEGFISCSSATKRLDSIAPSFLLPHLLLVKPFCFILCPYFTPLLHSLPSLRPFCSHTSSTLLYANMYITSSLASNKVNIGTAGSWII
eukprot:1157982-Pelagomonas_calceolata.AAC.9